MKRFFPFIIISCLICYCADLDRDNPLDPKNRDSSVNRAILVELFVNDSTGFEYCNYSLDAVERLVQREEYRDQLYVLEYHLTNPTNNWNDIYAQDEFNQRYYYYVPLTSERGIPDAMFNGLVKRVQGASIENIYNRYSSTADSLLGLKGYFRIEAEKKITGGFLNIDVTIAHYGRSKIEDIDLNVILYEDLGAPRYRFVVRKIFQKQTIPVIEAGEVKSFSFAEPLPTVNNTNSLFVLVFLQDQQGSKKEIFQVSRF